MAPLTATIASTGEVLEFDISSPDAIVESYRMLNEYANALKAVKEKLQQAASEIVNDRGIYDGGDYGIRVSNVQRMTYDKAVLRQVFDEDAVDLFLEPVKKKVDDYIKEHLTELGEDSRVLRDSMVPSGKPYTVVKLEKLRRE